jgi:hypothetical protein
VLHLCVIDQRAERLVLKIRNPRIQLIAAKVVAVVEEAYGEYLAAAA